MIGLLVASLALSLVQQSFAVPIANFSRFGSEVPDQFLPKADDVNARVDLSVPLLYFNTSFTHLYVSKSTELLYTI